MYQKWGGDAKTEVSWTQYTVQVESYQSTVLNILCSPKIQ